MCIPQSEIGNMSEIQMRSFFGKSPYYLQRITCSSSDKNNVFLQGITEFYVETRQIDLILLFVMINRRYFYPLLFFFMPVHSSIGCSKIGKLLPKKVFI